MSCQNPLAVAILLLTSIACHADDHVQLAVVEDERLTESSGLAVSYTHPDAVWIHNDSGDKPRLFLVGLNGHTRAVVNVEGVDDFDWEDMCSFQIDGQSWLLIGDIGDNARERGARNPECRLYLLKEPVVPRANGTPTMRWNVTAGISFDFEDGRFDCEALAVDVMRREILLLTKSLPQDGGLYRIPLDLSDAKQKHTAKLVARPFIPFATALDVSADGRAMIVGSMLNGLLIRRTEDQTWADAFREPATPLDLPPRKQGETICFDRDGKSVFLNSEKVRQPLWRLTLPPH